ncbi:hypothetical protein QQY24_29410 [Streptomyces sp. TG1A-8]|uniref:hypothetical protein n=1 Tax=Streptomyces sp. TG1A-8 TaxID=3051385 RepID=UPI00265BB394|nr:hypothetical protein [Streptomyces sp. TG1A-8]MDO0929326.1 hypothetical protein [Streptomyces sp. TG1A-8]
MKRTWWALPVLGAGVVAVRRARAGRAAGGRPDNRWLTVTINRSPTDVQPDGALPPPLDRFTGEVDVRVRPAPGDRGTELAVRPKEPPSRAATAVPARLAGRDPRQEIRLALREAKALLEAGEVLHPDTPPTTRPTPGGKLVGVLSRRSGGEGVL